MAGEAYDKQRHTANLAFAEGFDRGGLCRIASGDTYPQFRIACRRRRQLGEFDEVEQQAARTACSEAVSAAKTGVKPGAAGASRANSSADSNRESDSAPYAEEWRQAALDQAVLDCSKSHA